MIVRFLRKDAARSTQERLVLRGKHESISCHGRSERIIDVVYIYIQAFESSSVPFGKRHRLAV